MELGIVSSMSIIGMIVSCMICFVVPFVLLIYYAIKKKAKIVYFFIGGLTFFTFACVLEGIINIIVGKSGMIDPDNVILYAVYGGLMAAVFEETGRYIAMKFWMKDKLSYENALMYGVGHGGIEAMILVGLTYISNIATAMLINNGILQQSLSNLDPILAEQTKEQLAPLWETASYQFFLGGFERISAIILQIALSILVYMSIRYARKIYWGVAFGIHFLVDFALVIMASYMNIIVVEVVLLVVVVAISIVVFLFNKKECSLEENNDKEIVE